MHSQACAAAAPSSAGSQRGLIASTDVAGLDLLGDFLGVEEENHLIARINAEALTPFQFQQWQAKRLTRSYGYSYDFQRATLGPVELMPAWLAPVRDRAALSIGLRPSDLVQALLIYYRPGAGIGWHRDRPVFEHVVGISLGSAAHLRMRRRTGSKFERAAVPLERRSLYHLHGIARDEWEHSLAPIALDRWSITFRSLRPR